MILLEYNNRILNDTIDRIVRNPKTVVDVLVSDFDGARIHIFTDKEGEDTVAVVSLAWAIWASLNGHGREIAMKNNYGQFLAPKAEAGFDVTLRINVAKIPEEKKESLPLHISMIKRNLFAAPFNKFFEAAAQSKELPVLALEYRPQEYVYLKNVQNRTIVVFKIMFKDKDDQTLAKVFLQEFSRSTGGAPSVSYSYRNPPTDITGAQGATESDDHGYVSFVLFQAHISGNKKNSTLSNIQTFRNYLHYHIKCCKAYMHTRMRSRVTELLKILNRAKTEPLVKVKRNIKGKIISSTKN